MSNGRGLKGFPEYDVWVNLRQRCRNPNGHDAHYYNGIDYPPEWDDIGNFIMDVGFRPSSDHQIDRIDNTKGYSRENCRWVSKTTQMQNTRISKWWWVYGVRYASLSEAADVHHTTPSRIKAWCEGRTDGGYTYEARDNCWSEKKYD